MTKGMTIRYGVGARLEGVTLRGVDVASSLDLSVVGEEVRVYLQVGPHGGGFYLSKEEALELAQSITTLAQPQGT